MDPITIVLIVLFVIYILKNMLAFFLTGIMASAMGVMKAHMRAHKAKSRAADYAVLLTWLLFLFVAAKVIIPIITIVGLARGIQGYYLLSMIVFIVFAAIRSTGFCFGPVCRSCGTFRVDPIELLVIFFSAMGYFA